MVKLFALSVLHKSSEVVLLKVAHDLQSFSFFQRGTVQEFMTFASKTIVERTTLCVRQSVKEEDYLCHVFVRADGLAGVLISDHEYPMRVAHTMLSKVLDQFSNEVPRNQWVANSSINFEHLPAYLAKYQNPKEADALTKIGEELDETKIIVVNTLQALLERGEKLEDLVSKAENLSVQSKAFYKTAKKTNSCCSSLS